MLEGNFSPPGVVGFMNNAATDVEIMPAVVSSVFSLIPSPHCSFQFFSFLRKKKKKRHSSRRMRGMSEIVGPNKRDMG